MRFRILFAIAVLFLFFLAGCSIPSGGEFPERGRQWTIMVYMAADNDLAGEAVKDLQSMERVGSTEDVAIVVELDTPSGATRYFVDRGGSTVLEYLGNVNSGNPGTLLNFIRFARERYPAQRYALILWNHGSGVKGLSKDIAFDFAAQSAITLPELRNALALSGISLDLLGMDACLMQMVEVAYEVRNFARVLVSSQENVPGEGWDYETVLRTLVGNPTMHVFDLARLIVESYITYYQRYGVPGRYTLSAVDLSQIGTLARALDELALAILSDAQTPPWIYLALGDSALYFGDPDFVDLGDFMRILAFDPRVPFAVREKANVVLQQLAACVLSTRSLSISSGIIEASGLSIYFPYTAYVRKYGDLAFASATHWDELVQYLAQWRYSMGRRWKYASLRGSDSSFAQREPKELLETP